MPWQTLWGETKRELFVFLGLEGRDSESGGSLHLGGRM